MLKVLTGVSVFVAAFLGGLWLVWDRTPHEMKNDVALIRHALSEMKTTSMDVFVEEQARITDLRQHFAELTAQLRESNVSLSDLTLAVTGLSDTIQDVDAKLTESERERIDD